MQSSNQNSYEFIMNPQQQTKQGPGLGGPQRILMILGLFTVVIIVIVIFSSVFLSGGSANRNNLVTVSSYQVELERILDLGLDEISDQRLKQQFSTLSATVTSDNTELNSLLSARAYEITKIELAAQRDATVSETFDEAVTRANFDPVFEETVTAVAGDYITALQTALNGASTAREKEILSVSINNVQVVASQP